MNINVESDENQLNQIEIESIIDLKNIDLNNIDLNQDKLYKIVPNVNTINFLFLYTLFNLIELHSEEINFIYNHSFIVDVKNYFIKLDDSIQKNAILLNLKIINELIYNYKKASENDLIKGDNQEDNKEEMEKIKQDTLGQLTINNLGISLKTIKSVYSETIINIFKNKIFQNYSNDENLLSYLCVKEMVIDEETINKINEVIDSNDFYQKYILCENDLSDLKNNNPKNFFMKINFLYLALTYILKNSSIFERSKFLLDTNEFFRIYDNQLLEYTFEKKFLDRLIKVKSIFKDNSFRTNPNSNSQREINISENYSDCF